MCCIACLIKVSKASVSRFNETYVSKTLKKVCFKETEHSYLVKTDRIRIYVRFNLKGNTFFVDAIL